MEMPDFVDFPSKNSHWDPKNYFLYNIRYKLHWGLPTRIFPVARTTTEILGII